MKQESTLEKRARGKKITESRLTIWLKDRLYPMLMLLTRTKVKCRVETVNDCQILEKKPIIFAANHSAFTDTPIMLQITKRSYILAGKQNLDFLDWLFFTLNGVIWVDRGDKAEMAASKETLLEYLRKGQSILWFPEGTWNLTDNQLVMPMRWGIIDVARQADAQIIPVVLDYNKESNLCKVKFGTPMAGETLRDNRDAICSLRDTLATMIWEFMNRQPMLCRRDIDTNRLKAERYSVLAEYPPLDWEYEQTFIYRPYTTPEEVFAHLEIEFINQLPRTRADKIDYLLLEKMRCSKG